MVAFLPRCDQLNDGSFGSIFDSSHTAAIQSALLGRLTIDNWPAVAVYIGLLIDYFNARASAVQYKHGPPVETNEQLRSRLFGNATSVYDHSRLWDKAKDSVGKKMGTSGTTSSSSCTYCDRAHETKHCKLRRAHARAGFITQGTSKCPAHLVGVWPEKASTPLSPPSAAVTIPDASSSSSKKDKKKSA
jgi:hypothetical protein